MAFDKNDTKFPFQLSILGATGSEQAGFIALAGNTLSDYSVATVAASAGIGVTPNGRFGSATNFQEAFHPGVALASGKALIADAATSVVVTLDSAPPTDSLILVSLQRAVGTPNATSVISTLTGATITFTTAAAPGSGNTYAVNYIVL